MLAPQHVGGRILAAEARRRRSEADQLEEGAPDDYQQYGPGRSALADPPLRGDVVPAAVTTLPTGALHVSNVGVRARRSPRVRQPRCPPTARDRRLLPLARDPRRNDRVHRGRRSLDGSDPGGRGPTPDVAPRGRIPRRDLPRWSDDRVLGQLRGADVAVHDAE